MNHAVWRLHCGVSLFIKILICDYIQRREMLKLMVHVERLINKATDFTEWLIVNKSMKLLKLMLHRNLLFHVNGCTFLPYQRKIKFGKINCISSVEFVWLGYMKTLKLFWLMISTNSRWPGNTKVTTNIEFTLFDQNNLSLLCIVMCKVNLLSCHVGNTFIVFCGSLWC